ncbi:MAG: hypothetical protein HYY65_06045 [Candidatus Tectomicrobia bacterium]|uniref:Uncharacterized protein n=1 Tax=Tectimicrobiota bacterium TaxID=2528274 RepID=A0A932GP63_UNCTE|nr:hypothetical protein [Candidatus Tectomicrobia bacterium]
MEQSLSPGFFVQGRKLFYTEFLEFAGRYPEMRISLYVPQNDLPLLANEECSSIVRGLLNLCESGRLILMGMIPRSHLLAYLREIRTGFRNPLLPPDEIPGNPMDPYPDAA